MSEQAVAKSGFLAGLTLLQKLGLVFAAVVSLSGAGMWGVAATTAPDRTVSAEKAPPTDDRGDPAFRPEGFTDDATAGTPRDESENGDAGDDAEQDKTALELYSPTVFRLGFAFFVGFAIAFALRAAFKVVLIVVGTLLLLLVGLQMAGLITVNWEAMQGVYDTSMAWLATQTQSLTAFLRGYIPSGGTAVAGFGIGMLKGK